MQRTAIKVLALVVALILPASLAYAGSYAGTFEYHSGSVESGFAGVVNGTYTGSSSNAGVFGKATANYGNGVIGRAYGVYGHGIVGEAYENYGSGIYGYSSKYRAIFGHTYHGRDAIYGWSPTTANGRGVVGLAQGDQGIGMFGHASSTNYSAVTTGVYGVTSGGRGSGVRGISLSGASVNFGGYFQTYSRIGYGVLGYASATSGRNYGVLGRSASPSGYGVYSDGNMWVTGNFKATGSKSAVVQVGEKGHVLLYAEESTENWFTDYGKGELNGGKTVVQIDPLFAQTVNTENEYHVFLTPKGDCKGLYVTNEAPGSFEVRELGSGKSSIAFSYRIVVKRKGYESERLARVSPPKDTALSKGSNTTLSERRLVSTNH